LVHKYRFQAALLNNSKTVVLLEIEGDNSTKALIKINNNNKVPAK